MSGFLDNLGNALANPGVDALLGMTGSFAQAAMPTRIPTPWASALGAGLSGLAPGAQQGRSAQLQQQQVQAAQLQNQMTKMYLGALPGAIPGSAGATSSFTPAGGAPVADANGNAPAAPSTVASGGTATPSYLVPPSQLVSLGNLALLRGDPGAAASFYSQAQAPAGGPGFAMGQGGGAFATPGGGKDPRVLMTNAAATAAGTKGAEAPYVPPAKYPVPTLNADGSPALDAQGHPMFHDQWMTAPQANAAATTGAGNPSTTPAIDPSSPDPFPGWAHQINGAENATGNPAAPNASGPGGTPTSTAMGNGQFLDGTWPAVIRAARPDLAAGKTDAELLPLRAVPGLADSATEQYARMNGATLAQGGLPVTGATVAMAHMLGPTGAATVLKANPTAPLSMLPGMTPILQANPNLRGMTAGQLTQQYAARMGALPTQGVAAPQLPGIAGMPALTDVQKPYDLRQGGMHVNPGDQTVVKNPEPTKLILPSGQTIEGHMNPASPFAPEGTPGTFAPVIVGAPPGATTGTPPAGPMYQPLATGAPGASPVPGAPAPGTTATTALPPDVVEGREELTKGLFGKDTDSYVAANNTQGWLTQINHAGQVMNQAGGAYQTGPFAPVIYDGMANVNGFMRGLGMDPVFQQAPVASYEEANKATTTAGFELSSHYEGHARQAAQTIMNATSAVPSVKNSPVGLTLVSDGINEAAQSAIDMHNYKMARYNGQDPYGLDPTAVGTSGGAGLETAETDFVKAYPAPMYAQRAISTVTPVQITDPKQFTEYLPGTYFIGPKTAKNPTGLAQVPQRPGAPPVPSYLQPPQQSVAPQ